MSGEHIRETSTDKALAIQIHDFIRAQAAGAQAKSALPSIADGEIIKVEEKTGPCDGLLVSVTRT